MRACFNKNTSGSWLVLNNGKVVHPMEGFEQMLIARVGLWLKGFLKLEKAKIAT